MLLEAGSSNTQLFCSFSHIFYQPPPRLPQTIPPSPPHGSPHPSLWDGPATSDCFSPAFLLTGFLAPALATRVHSEARVILIKCKQHHVTPRLKTFQSPPIGLRKKDQILTWFFGPSATWSLFIFLAWLLITLLTALTPPCTLSCLYFFLFEGLHTCFSFCLLPSNPISSPFTQLPLTRVPVSTYAPLPLKGLPSPPNQRRDRPLCAPTESRASHFRAPITLEHISQSYWLFLH